MTQSTIKKQTKSFSKRNKMWKMKEKKDGIEDSQLQSLNCSGIFFGEILIKEDSFNISFAKKSVSSHLEV